MKARTTSVSLLLVAAVTLGACGDDGTTTEAVDPGATAEKGATGATGATSAPLEECLADLGYTPERRDKDLIRVLGDEGYVANINLFETASEAEEWADQLYSRIVATQSGRAVAVYGYDTDDLEKAAVDTCLGRRVSGGALRDALRGQ